MYPNTKYIVYIYYNKKKEPLYVGCSSNFPYRDKQHKATDSRWYNEVAYVSTAEYETGEEMCVAEAFYISKLQPMFNKVGKYGNGMCFKNISISDNNIFETLPIGKHLEETGLTTISCSDKTKLIEQNLFMKKEIAKQLVRIKELESSNDDFVNMLNRLALENRKLKNSKNKEKEL